MTPLRALALAVTLAAAQMAAPPVLAQDQGQTQADAAIPAQQLERIWTALDIGAALDIMREEGEAMSVELADRYLPGQAGTGWQRAIGQIYDPATMDAAMRDAFAADLRGADIAPMLAFFDSDLGRRIIALEMSARRAFMDRDTEQAARDRVNSGGFADDRMALIDRFIEVNDLVTFNLSGALNSNVAFLTGLATTELFEMSEQDILDQVWNDAEESRADTEDWLRAYLATSYQPLGDEDIVRYIEFSQTKAGQRLNRALFAGFSVMNVEQSRALGLAVAQQMSAQEL